MNRLLIIEDNGSSLSRFEAPFKEHYKVCVATTVQDGLEMLRRGRVSVVLLDLSHLDVGGTEVVATIHREIDPHLPIIALGDLEDTDKAVAAIRSGAFDFVPKAIEFAALAVKIAKALEHRDIEVRLNALQSSFSERQNKFIFASEVMKGINFEITRLANLPFDVLIIGETGVGKDLAAWQLHYRSARRDKSFIPISMKSLNETLIESELFGHEKGSFSGAERQKTGKFEAANGGTIYIPEISCLSEAIQLKLLYFLQYKSISRVGQDPKKSELRLNVRLLMATNENLQQLVESGRIREDFYHRIVGVRLTIPPLREHTEDIEPLVEYFLQSRANNPTAKKYVLGPGTLDALKAYQWPGNVRELENSVRHALAYAEDLDLRPEHFPHLAAGQGGGSVGQFPGSEGSGIVPYREAETAFRKKYFESLRKLSGNDVNEAARLAGITPQGLRKILHGLGIR